MINKDTFFNNKTTDFFQTIIKHKTKLKQGYIQYLLAVNDCQLKKVSIWGHQKLEGT